MRQVHKYNISLMQPAVLPIPASATIVLVAVQRDVFRIWFEVSTEDPVVNPRTFAIFATGQDLPVQAQHVHSVITQSGEFVWHVYELYQ